MSFLRPDLPDQPPGLAATLDRLWAHFLPEILQRLAVLETAAAALAAGNLTPEQHQAAHAAAHKLAGTLGTFGLTEATAPAREVELLYSADSEPCDHAARLTSLTTSLRRLIESRKALHAPAK
jgi:HPt (histidine-containing phosphotransfer) domain-containing protein